MQPGTQEVSDSSWVVIAKELQMTLARSVLSKDSSRSMVTPLTLARRLVALGRDWHDLHTHCLSRDKKEKRWLQPTS
jgi:hypothetical protein